MRKKTDLDKLFLLFVFEFLFEILKKMPVLLVFFRHVSEAAVRG